MPTRDLSNKRVQIWLGLASSLASYQSCTAAELAAMIPAAPAIRWDGWDFGMQASQQDDDRSLDDDATATIRGFEQFGGGVPFFFPKVTDLSSVLRDVYDLVKVQGTELALVQRIGWVDRRTAAVAGDNVSIFKVMSDGFQPDTEGTGGYAYIQNLLPRGDVAPWTIVAGAAPVAVTVTGGAITGAAGTLHLRRATYIGNDVTQRATWASSNEATALVDNRGIVELVGAPAATADITATFPGGLTSAATTVTIS